MPSSVGSMAAEVWTNTTVPSPYSVKYGTWAARNSTGTKPPASSNRSTTSLAPVGCAIPSMSGDGAGPTGVPEGPAVGGWRGLCRLSSRER